MKLRKKRYSKETIKREVKRIIKLNQSLDLSSSINVYLIVGVKSLNKVSSYIGIHIVPFSDVQLGDKVKVRLKPTVKSKSLKEYEAEVLHIFV